MRKMFWLVPVCAALLCFVPARSIAEDKEKDEGKEEKVKIDQVPQAVRDTLKEESKGAAIDQVDKQTGEGKTIYEADVKINGHNYEIKVAEDGLLISKKLDEGEGEKDKGKEKDEKDEKEKK